MRGSTWIKIGPPLSRLRGLLALGLCLCLALALLPGPARAAAAGSWTEAGNYETAWYGNGSEAAYSISSAAELAGLAYLSGTGKTFQGKTVNLTADVDLAAHTWPGIANFQGAFNGSGHTVSNMTQSITASSAGTWGFFNKLQNAAVTGLRLYAPTAEISIRADVTVSYGLLTGDCGGGVTIKDCVVERARTETTFGGVSEVRYYAGGLVGGGAAGTGAATVSNSGVLGMTVVLDDRFYAGTVLWSGLGQGTYQNCFVQMDSFTTSYGKFSYLGRSSDTAASYCYWLDAGLTQDAAAAAGTECYPVTAEQMLGEGSQLIGAAESTYAATGSLVKALNNWVRRAGPGRSSWSARTGAVNLTIFLPPPDYIDIGGPLTPARYEDAQTVDADLTLEGQARKRATLISVTLPASLPFILDVDGAGGLKRVLSATGKLTSRSDCAVTVSLTAVDDAGGLLDKAALFLVPGGDIPPVSLADGPNQNHLLAALAVPAAGAPAAATVKVEGAPKSGAASVGADGREYTVGLTLKVSKQ